ncbi:preprotein translocase subunit SecE [Natranaerobius thermophilus]|uniref:Protein translocase subunit SecE n=1 Tax=Natranaerobius thermophilus (strain ATCC BAA-1301 / DSM 18059 / JW/NM-WN-LF) TaxID=457570 RepID=B2A4C4_NATTJ|nr:preprotein translocase subunit SecE [Natranaerobius thermophilus]ACB83778.1 preprotein translocase, SecE subunit [Natranaerobius thermophilus JW/NM-WN-LF]
MGLIRKALKFLRETKIELKKVNWPNRQQLITYTGVVLMTVAIVGVYFWILDTAFIGIIQLMIQ